MVKIDLITGFLGSGKTTFIKKYAKYFMDKGQKIGILENDFGAVNIDMLLLQDIEGDNCELEMIAGGCDKDCHQRRFKTKLISMGMRGFDRILIEPSGIFDVDEFFDILREEPLDRWYEIGNVITIVDAHLEQELSKESEFLLASQVANAGIIVMSKTKGVEITQISQVIDHINLSLEKCKCPRKIEKEVLSTDWEQLQDQDFEQLASCGCVHQDYQKLWFEQNESYQSVYFMNLQISQKQFEEKVKELFEDKDCGQIIRIKGFMQVEENKWVEVNATKKEIIFNTIKKGQEVFIVIGENLNEEKIKNKFQ